MPPSKRHDKKGINMDFAGAELKVLRLRLAGLGAQIDSEWAAKLSDQRHLDRDTSESAYWHSGYYQALSDVLEFMAPSDSISDTSDTSSPLRAVG
jgi:hypothetical protein